MIRKSILRIYTIITLICCVCSAYAKKYPFDRNHSYDVSIIRVGQAGTKYLKVYGVGSNADKAITQAMQDAVAACIFSGVPGNEKADKIEPICKNGNEAYVQNKAYFEQFFTSGDFLLYVKNTNSMYPTGENNVGVSGGRRVGINVEVMFDELRNRLENDKIEVSLLKQATAIGQKPTIMVVPDKAWCINNRFVRADNPNSPDYEKALLNDDVLNVVTEMGGIMAGRGYPLKNLRSALDELQNEAAIDIAAVSKGDGEIVEDDLDKLTRIAQADILVQIAFTRQKDGARNRVEFRVTSIDAANSKQIDGRTGQSSSSGAPINMLLKEAVLGFMDNFTGAIQRHFQDVAENGREGNIIFKIADDCPMNFESEVTLNGDTGELSEAIEYWLSENALDSNFTQGSKSRVRLNFEQVRFPLYGKGKFGGKQKAINAEGFVKPIGTFLSQFGISTATIPAGIGKVYVILGGL